MALWGLPLTLSGAPPPYEPAVLGLMCVVGVGNALVDVGPSSRLCRDPRPRKRCSPESSAPFESLVALLVALGSLFTPLVIELLGMRDGPPSDLIAPRRAVALAWQAPARDRLVDWPTATRRSRC